jgi:hypothetical protein
MSRIQISDLSMHEKLDGKALDQVRGGIIAVLNPGTICGFNPQPDPPGDRVGFNPQPDPPGAPALTLGPTLGTIRQA